MYRAIIIDDEDAVRNGLRYCFDWEFYGLTVVAEFTDCAKAYAYIRENPVDLAVTDVITPVMDGITFAQKLQEEYPAIQVVFISGHADVELLRNAMKTDAIDYILKSVDLNELAATVRRVVDLLDKKNHEKSRVAAMEEQLKQLQPLLRERLLRALLNNENDIGAAQYLGLDLEPERLYVCIVIHLSNNWDVMRGMPAGERLRMGIECERLCGEALHGRPGSISFKNRTSEFIILLKCGDSDYEQDVLEISGQIQRSFLDSLGLEASIGISEPAAIADFKGAYDEAREAIEQHYYLVANSSIAIKKHKEVKELKAAREIADKRIPDTILSGDKSQVREALDQIFGYLWQLPEEDQDNFMIFLLNLPTRLLADLKTKDKGPYANQRRLMEGWLNCEGRSEQESFIRGVMMETTELLTTVNKPGTNSLIRLVESIIVKEYMTQLSVTSLASQVYLTPTYLCVLFKESTGKTINEYLTAVRLDHAKELLRDPSVRLYDVCYQVGYLSPSYFSKLFKKQTGMTPGEYREKALSH